MTQRDRHVCALTADGYTAAEVARKLQISQRTVEGVRGRPEAKALIARYREDGIDPEARLEIISHSPNEAIALRAAVELHRLRAGLPPDDDMAAPRIEVVAAP